MIDLAGEWLSRAGAKVKPGVAVEISPLSALEPRDLRIEPGMVIDQPRYFA